MNMFSWGWGKPQHHVSGDQRGPGGGGGERGVETQERQEDLLQVSAFSHSESNNGAKDLH